MAADPNVNSERIAVIETEHRSCMRIQQKHGEDIVAIQAQLQTVNNGRIWDRALLMLVILLVILSATPASPIGKILARIV